MSDEPRDEHDPAEAVVDGVRRRPTPSPGPAGGADPPGVPGAGATTPTADDAGAPEGIVDWQRTGRRVVTTGLGVAVSVVVVWIVAGLLGDGVRLADLGDWVGLGLGVIVVSEVVVVGSAAVRAERRAAVRGERLGSEDIGLLPPRIPRPTRRRDRD